MVVLLARHLRVLWVVPIFNLYKASSFGFSRYCPNKEDINNLIEPLVYREFLEIMWDKFMKYQNSRIAFILKDHLWKLFLYEKGIFNIEEDSDLIMDGCDNFEACTDCELFRYCRGCPSVSKCATGNFYAKDPQCWKKLR